MTAPVFAACKCGHSKEHHEIIGLAPQCTAGGCACLSYRPDVPRETPRPSLVQPTRPPGEPALVRDLIEPTIEQLIAAGRRSSRMSKLAEKIAADVANLRDRLNAERSAAEAKRKAEEATAAAVTELAQLEARVAELKATVKKKRTPPAITRIPGSQPCPDCERTFDTPQGRGSHRARVHGHTRAAG